MKKVILINPAYPRVYKRGMIVIPNNFVNPVALPTVGAILKQAGFSIRILDANILRLSSKKVVRMVNRGNFDAAVIASQEMDRWECPVPETKYFLHILKNIKAKKKIIFGPHVTINPKKYLLAHTQVIVGEPESAFPKALGQHDKIIRTDFIYNLDVLPIPAYDLLPMHKYNEIAVVTSRGCPAQCIFCFKTMYGNRYRFRSPQKVISEINLLVEKYQKSFINFWDLEFCLNSKRVFEICKYIKKQNLKFNWACNARASSANLELLKIMRVSGLDRLNIGVESGSEETLREIKKNVSIDQAKQAITWARKAGIKNIASTFMIGFPKEDRQRILRSFRFFKKFGGENVFCNVVIPYPNTELFERARIKPEWHLIRKKAGVVDNKFSRKDIVQLKNQINLKLLLHHSFFNLSRVLRQIFSPKNKRFYVLSKEGRKNLKEYFLKRWD